MFLVKVMNQRNRNVYHTEEQKEMLHFVIVLVCVVILVIGVYFFSKIFVLDKSLFEIDYQTGTINNERIVVGTIFNRPESEYYVIAYDETVEQAVYYSAISTNYTNNQENALKVYHLDLDNALNKPYYVGSDGISNSKATKSSEIKLKDLTLIKIKNGKIEKYLEGIDSIEKELAVTKKKTS